MANDTQFYVIGILILLVSVRYRSSLRSMLKVRGFVLRLVCLGEVQYKSTSLFLAQWMTTQLR